MTLSDLGWSEFFETAFELVAKETWVPGRLIRETKINFSALLDDGEEVDCVVGGKVWHEATCDADLPAVGDWVAIELGGDDDEHMAIFYKRDKFRLRELNSFAINNIF